MLILTKGDGKQVGLKVKPDGTYERIHSPVLKPDAPVRPTAEEMLALLKGSVGSR